MPIIQPRRAGVLIPVFAIRTADDLGIGDIGGVRQLVDWAADTGLDFLQFLPINATGSDSSPYNAISSVALDYLTLELTPAAVPELDEKFYRTITGLMRADLLRHGAVKYPKVRKLKTTLLRRAFSHLQNEYNLLVQRDLGDTMPLCRAEAIRYVAFSPLAGGLLSGKYRQDRQIVSGRMNDARAMYEHLLTPASFAAIEALKQRAADKGWTVPGAALRFVLDTPGVDLIIAPRSAEQFAGYGIKQA